MITTSIIRVDATVNLLGMLVITTSVMLAGCEQSPAKPYPHEMLNATLWQQTSAEYLGVTTQTYQLARINLDQALADTSWTAALEQTGDYSGLPPAIMLDIDETILDNGIYEARIIHKLGSYSPSSFAKWCQQENAPLVPGVRKFLDYAIAQNVAVFYFSSRREKLRTCTSRNLRERGLPLPDDSRLLLNNSTNKSVIRERVAKHYRILLLVGDNLEDFLSGSKSDPASRRQLASRYTNRWGRQWIILPNSIYGHWEASMYNFLYELPRDEQLRLKLQQLQ